MAIYFLWYITCSVYSRNSFYRTKVSVSFRTGRGLSRAHFHSNKPCWHCVYTYTQIWSGWWSPGYELLSWMMHAWRHSVITWIRNISLVDDALTCLFSSPASFKLCLYGNIWCILFIHLSESHRFWIPTPAGSILLFSPWKSTVNDPLSGAANPWLLQQASWVTTGSRLRLYRLAGSATECNIRRMKQIITEKEHGAQVTFPGE